MKGKTFVMTVAASVIAGVVAQLIIDRMRENEG